MEVKRVVVVLDPEAEHQTALGKTLALEFASDIELVLLSCEHTQYLVEGYYFEAVDIERLRKEYVTKRQAMLEKIAGPLRDNGLTVTCRAEWGYPGYETILRVAKEEKADIVVHEVAKHGAISRMFLTHEDWQLVRHCPIPLLMVKERPWSKPLKVIAAVDPMHARHKPGGLDHKILDTALHFSKLLGGDVYAVHAYEALPFSGEYPEDARAAHRRVFQVLLDDYDLDSDHQMLIESSPEFALQEAENELDSDLVVMGAISRSILSDVFIGSSAEKVLDYLKSDVLIIK